MAGAASGRLFDSVADFGTLTCYGLLESDDVVFNAAQFIFRDVNVQGYSRLRYGRGSLVPMRKCSMPISLTAKKRLVSHAHSQDFAFEDICEAVELAERSGGQGKVLLIPDAFRAELSID